ncbi:MAG TPA: ATP-binding protein [Thermoguttaceae bacterium]|nr:ATP-binding protein [Thermoguttaceae bacterium]
MSGTIKQTNRSGPAETRVLLVEHDPADAQRVWLALSEARGAMEVQQGLFNMTWVERLAPALDLLAQEKFDALLLDLQLPDAEGFETLERVRKTAADVPVIVLTAMDDDGQALLAIQGGAQDYAAKDRLDGRLLGRTIRHAIERQRAEVQLRRHAREVEAARTRIEQQAAELRARAEQLDRINRELDDFTYIASHDLKEPLRGIAAYCDILREDYHDKIDAAGQQRLNKLGDLCKRLETLVGDLLTYCRVGGIRPAQTGIDLSAVVHEALETLLPVIERRRASVRVADRLPTVTGDATLIGMVLSNLITNALRFNDNAQPSVEIGCMPTDPPAIYVRDDGIGIEAKHHEEIFTIFRRLHGRKEYEGSGAGLTIVRKIIESHGGRIWLESELGNGTTFYFTLAPAKEQKLIPRQATEPSPKPPHWAERSHRGKRKRRRLVK